MGKFSIIKRLRSVFRRESWRETMRRLEKEWVPLRGEAATLQGEMIRSIGNLRSEARHNGWMNWSVYYEEAIEVLLRYLPDNAVFPTATCQKIRQALAAIRYAGSQGADEGVFAYDELDFVAEQVVIWCQHHPQPIEKAIESTWLE